MPFQAMKWISIAALLLAVLFSNPAPIYQVALTLVVTVSAVFVLITAWQEKKYWSAAGFLAVAILFNPAMSAAAAAGDLSKYRGFEFGTDLAGVARQAEVSASQAKVIHSRPAVMQELEWRPRGLGTAHRDESANDVVFSFYDGALYRIAVTYDRFKMEGMTTEDIIDAVSTLYGPADQLTDPIKVGTDSYGDQDEVVARWQDSQYSFDLIRSSYGPGFRLVGVIKRLDALAQAAVAKAKLLDDQEAPQREAARVVAEVAAAKDKLEKARLANKARFRP